MHQQSPWLIGRRRRRGAPHAAIQIVQPMFETGLLPLPEDIIRGRREVDILSKTMYSQVLALRLGTESAGGSAYSMVMYYSCAQDL